MYPICGVFTSVLHTAQNNKWQGEDKRPLARQHWQHSILLPGNDPMITVKRIFPPAEKSCFSIECVNTI